jgi:mRNA interferase RelE/StbE
MSYRLEFLPSAKKEWDKLGQTIRRQFVNKLRERLETPRVLADALRGMPDHYKIKLRSVGYRLVYRIEELRITVVVIAVGKRDKSRVYKDAEKRRR